MLTGVNSCVLWARGPGHSTAYSHPLGSGWSRLQVAQGSGVQAWSTLRASPGLGGWGVGVACGGPGRTWKGQGPGPRKGAWVGAVQEAERRLQAPPPPSRRQHAAPPGSAPSRLPSACRAHAWGGMEAAPRPPRCLRRCLTTRTPQSSTTLPSFFSHQPREDPKALPLVFTPLSGSGKNVSLPHTPLYSQDHNEFATQSLPFLSTSSTLGHL